MRLPTVHCCEPRGVRTELLELWRNMLCCAMCMFLDPVLGL